MCTHAWHRIGHVIKRHGITGSVKIYLEEKIQKTCKTLFVSQQNRPTPFFIENVDWADSTAIVKFEEIDTPEQASKLAQQPIYLPQKDYNEQQKDHKKTIMGYRVLHQTKTLGTIKHINDYAPNPLLTVACADKDILIPLNDYFVQKIDHHQQQITVVLPDGFLAI